MDPAVEKMEAQLRLWSLKINTLAAKTQARVPTSFDTLMHIDELKVLHAIAQSKLIEFKAVKDTMAHLKTQMESAWKDLDAALQGTADADGVGGERVSVRRNTASRRTRVD
jgi:hypothetical protein